MSEENVCLLAVVVEGVVACGGSSVLRQSRRNGAGDGIEAAFLHGRKEETHCYAEKEGREYNGVCGRRGRVSQGKRIVDSEGKRGEEQCAQEVGVNIHLDR